LSRKKLSIVLLYFNSESTRTLSYHEGWAGGFRNHPRFNCTALNLGGPWLANRLRTRLVIPARRYDAVVALHSVFANSCFLTGRLLDFFRKLRVPTAFFIANEYKLIPEKLALARDLGTVLFITQTASPGAIRLYEKEMACRVVSLSHAGLDSRVYRPAVPCEERPLDLGFRGGEEPCYFGHQDRQAISGFFQTRAEELGLKVDISYAEPGRRFDREGWAAFLNRCKGQLGTESGSDFFEVTDNLRLRVIAYVTANPGWTMSDLWERFFSRYADPVPARIISGRIVEAAGTKTVQILFEGEYNGYFKPDVHYIALKKDFSNIEEVIRKFHDRAFTSQIIDNAYRLAHEELTYEKLIERFYRELCAVL
jgi:hypothetical protein